MGRLMFFFLVVVAPVLALLLAWLGFVTVSSNPLGWFLLLIGLAYAVGATIYFLKKKGETPLRKEERGDRSFWLILPGFIIAMYGAPVEFLYPPEILP